MTLRAAREADGPAIGAIKVETWRQAYAGLLSPAFLSGLDVGQESAEWGAYARRPPDGHRLIVACVGDEVDRLRPQRALPRRRRTRRG